tara:strand:+ start:492 stop:2879 length:2388 start_codon:yes stop_codon:yes gene_type:complete
MITFNWDAGRKTFPNEADEKSIEKDMLNYIQSPIESLFINRLNKAREGDVDSPMTPENLELFNNTMKKILKRVEKTKLKDGLSQNAEAYKKLTTSLVKVRKEKDTDDEDEEGKKKTVSFYQDERKPDEMIISLLENFLLEDLFNLKKMDRLTGVSSMTFQEESNIPEFDYSEMIADKINEDDYYDNLEFSFRLEEYDRTKKEKEEAIYLTSRRYKIQPDEQFKLNNVLTEKEIKQAKENHILEATKISPRFMSKSDKTVLPAIKHKFPIKIPKDILSELDSDLGKTIRYRVVDIKRDKNGKALKVIANAGESREMESPQALNIISPLIGNDDREPFFKDAGVYEYDGKLIQFITDISYLTDKDKDASPKTFILDDDKNFTNDLAERFVKKVREIENKLVHRYQKDPLKVYTFTATGVIKNSYKPTSKLSEQMDRKGFKKEVEVTKLNKKGKYITTELSVGQMQEIEKEAFMHLKTKNKISIEKYQSLSEDEKTNYVPTFTVWEGKELIKPKNKLVSTGKYRFKDAPEDATHYLTEKKPIWDLKQEYITYRTKSDPSKFIREGDPVGRFIEIKGSPVQYVSIKTGKIISSEEYSKLPKAQKDRHFRRPLGRYPLRITDLKEVEEFQILPRKAYNKRTIYVPNGEYLTEENQEFDEKNKKKNPVVIDEKQYKKFETSKRTLFVPINESIAMTEEEKESYTKNLREKIQAKDEPIDVKNYGKLSASRRGVTATKDLVSITTDEIEESLENANIYITVTMQERGRFRIVPIRRNTNQEAEEMLDTYKDRLSILRREVGA